MDHGRRCLVCSRGHPLLDPFAWRYGLVLLYAIMGLIVMSGCRETEQGVPPASAAGSSGTESRNSFSRSPFPQGVKRAPTDPASLEYWVLVSQPMDRQDGDDGYDNDGKLWFSGDPFHGKAILVVNDTPVAIIAQGGSFDRINEWLVPGKNTIWLEGDFRDEVYLKVVALRNKDFRPERAFRFEGVVAKMRVNPAKLHGEQDKLRLTFEAKIDYRPFFDVLPLDQDGQHRIAGEVRDYVKELFGLIQKHDWESYTDMTVAPWEARPRWGVARDLFLRGRESDKPRIEDSDWQLITKPEDIKLISGRYSVLGWAGRRHRDRNIPMEVYYSFVWKNRVSKKEYFEAPLRFVRVGGRWEYW